MAKLVTLEERQLRNFQKLAVIGDIHGDYDALQSALKIFDPTKDGIIFLGDYADRGSGGTEVIASVTSLIKKYPATTFALKGNHESYYSSGEPKFGLDRHSLIREVETKEGNWSSYFKHTFTPFVNRLHLAAIVPGEALFVHGGVSYGIRELDDLKYPTARMENDILWSDPMQENGEDTDLWGRPKFGPDVSERVCQRLGVKRIIRSHEPSRVMKAGGPCYSHNGRVLTTSTTKYSTRVGTYYKPFVLSISPADFSIEAKQIDVDPAVESEIVECNSS